MNERKQIVSPATVRRVRLLMVATDLVYIGYFLSWAVPWDALKGVLVTLLAPLCMCIALPSFAWGFYTFTARMNVGLYTILSAPEKLLKLAVPLTALTLFVLLPGPKALFLFQFVSWIIAWVFFGLRERHDLRLPRPPGSDS